MIVMKDQVDHKGLLEFNMIVMKDQVEHKGLLEFYPGSDPPPSHKFPPNET